jgi:NADH dehydrogenase (ubiquinone) 1 alpha subcomplex subunit 5
MNSLRIFTRSIPLARRSLSTVTKTTTGLVGLPVHPDPIPALISANKAVLTRLTEIPADAGYRINAEKVANFRIAKAEESAGDIDAVEKAVACGQIEELIVQAEDEMEVVEMYIRERLWEDMRRTETVKVVEEKTQEGDK